MNWLTYLVAIVVVVLLLTVYMSKSPSSMSPPMMMNPDMSAMMSDPTGYNENDLQEDLVITSPFCESMSANACVNSPSCSWNGVSCQDNTVYYPSSNWYNLYDSYLSPWRWSYPNYTTSYVVPVNYGWWGSGRRWGGGGRRWGGGGRRWGGGGRRRR